jgi:predicted negative regulator of RcsB-dependent stress response
MMRPDVEPLLRCKSALYESEVKETNGDILAAIEAAQEARLCLDAWQLALTEELARRYEP